MERQYDILELQKMNMTALDAIAKSMGLSAESNTKQTLIYSILDEQNSKKLPFERIKNVYIIAKITGLLEKEVAKKYEMARKKVKDHGYNPICPIDYVVSGTDWHEAMRICIPLMLSCDYYIYIDEPHTTAGGLVEETIANWVRLPKLLFSKI